MSLFRRGAPGATKVREPAPVRVELGSLRLDVAHRVTHSYEPKPEPRRVMLEFRAADTGEMLGGYPASFPGCSVRVPKWVLARAAEHGADELDVVVTW